MFKLLIKLSFIFSGFAAVSAYAATPSLPLVSKIVAPSHQTQPAPLLILMHGFGSNEEDLIGLTPGLTSNFIYVSLRAPYKTNIGGYQWYETQRTGGNNSAISDELKVDRAAVMAAIKDVEQKYKVDTKHIFIAGFSQGAAMTYDIALHYPKIFAGAGVLSGAFLPPSRADIDLSAAYNNNPNLSWFIAHGFIDQRVPIQAAMNGLHTLQNAGFMTNYHVYPQMRHSINEAEIADFKEWLESQIK